MVNNLASALCIMLGVLELSYYQLLHYGFNWWALGLLIFGFCIFQYQPKEYRKLIIKGLDLDNQKKDFELELLKRKVMK